MGYESPTKSNTVAKVNGQPHSFEHILISLPKTPEAQPAELAPGLPGFWVFMVRAHVRTIEWLEMCFAQNAITLEIAHDDKTCVVEYWQAVDFIRETPKNATEKLTSISASFGFYRVKVTPKAGVK